MSWNPRSRLPARFRACGDHWRLWPVSGPAFNRSRERSNLMSDNGGSETGAFLAGFIVGGLVGAATALILAPQSGERTRTQIREKSIELRDRAEDLADDARVRAEEAAEEARKRADELSVRAEQAAVEARKRAEELGTRSREVYGQQ